MGTPERMKNYSNTGSGSAGTPPVPSTTTHARLIEILHCIHAIAALLSDPGILDDRVRAVAGANRSEGVGVSEAPRGTLLHHYRVDENGLIEWANLIIATGHNNLAMNRGVLEVARKYVHGTEIQESMLNESRQSFAVLTPVSVVRPMPLGKCHSTCS